MQAKGPASDKQHSTPATSTVADTQTSALALADLRPAALAQRKHIEAIHDSRRVQQQRALQDSINSPSAAAHRHSQAAQLSAQPDPKAASTGLPAPLKTGIEALSGMSMDHVNVRYNSSRPAQLNAHAYAQGSEIHLAPGQERHLPHEAWHVVQQAQGRVKPTMQAKGTPVNDDARLEAEADSMGSKALAAGRAKR